jgi:hypothetical protein
LDDDNLFDLANMFEDLDDRDEEEEEQPYVDTEQATLLVSFQMVLRERSAARATEKANVTLLAHVIDISIERAPMEEDTSILIEAEQQKIYELNTQMRAKITALEASQVVLNEEFHNRRVLALRRREAPARPTEM